MTEKKINTTEYKPNMAIVHHIMKNNY